ASPPTSSTPGSTTYHGETSLAKQTVNRRDDRLELRRSDGRIDADAPQDVVADGALDIGSLGRVTALGQRVLGVVEHRDLDPVARERRDEGRDRAVALAVERHGLTSVGELDREGVRAVLATRGLGRAQREPTPRLERGAVRGG